MIQDNFTYMKRAKSQIIQTSRGPSKYFLSIFQKQNDSGILFNQRLFFLLSGQHIGYISEFKMSQSPQQINFQKPKITVLLTNIKTIVVNHNQLSIKFNLIDGNKKSERTWILRIEKEELTRQWYDLLQREKMGSTINKTLSPKKTQMPQGLRLSPKKIESPEKKKELTINRNLELSENVKQKEFKQIGIGVSPKNTEQKKIVFKDPEEEMKSIMSVSPKRNDDEKKKNKPQVQALPPKSVQQSVQRSIYKQNEQTIERPIQKSIQKQKKILEKSFERQQLQKSSEQTLLNTSRKDISQVQRSSQQRVHSQMKPTLVNTKYLNSQNRQKSNRSKDYLDRTHQLIKSLQTQRSNHKQSVIVLTKIEQQEFTTPTKVAEIAMPIQKSENWSQIPWTFKYVKYGHLIFKQFQSFTQKLMKQLVLDQSRRRDSITFKPKLIKNGINYYDISDIEVKMAFIGLQDIDSSSYSIQTERVCNKKSVKLLQNQFNNFKALYEYLDNKQKLRVPLVCLCAHNGFVALFKVTSRTTKKSIRFKQIQFELSQLQKRSKIHVNFMQSLNNLIIQLDEAYYQQLKQKQDEALNFNLFIIQQIQQFLLPDLITDNPNERMLILRKQLIDNYRIDVTPIKKDISLFKQNWNKSGFSKQLQAFSKNILIAISNAIIEMDSFHAYFLTSNQFSSFLHGRGINIRYLGHLYQNLKTVFQKRFVMTQMAVRSCKSLFRKTLQDLALGQDAPEGPELHCKICDFLNCVLGSTFETAAIWKVLSTHAKAYFGFQLNFDQIDRGHFMISLIQNLKLDVAWDKVKPEEAFKSNIFFTEKNLMGLGMHSKSYIPIFTQTYTNTVKILQGEEVYEGFEALVAQLDLKNKSIPPQLSIIQPEIRRYISFFLSPTKSRKEYSHLNLYESTDTCPSRLKFDLLLMQIKWALKQGQREEYIKMCDVYIRTATKYFGQYHPIFSQLYELFSAYHLSSSQYEDAITFAKSSLVNILRVCGSTHEKTAQCYFHLALCYIKSSKREEGAAHIKKALAILEANGKTEGAAYAAMQLKLGLLLLNQGQVEDCARLVANAQSIFQGAADGTGRFEDEATQCLQLLHRCYQLLQWKAQTRQLLAQCENRLRKTSHPRNLQRILKIYLHPLLAALSPQQASDYLDLISALSAPPDHNNSQLAFSLLRNRISQGSFLPSLQTYLSKLQSIEQHIRQKAILRNGWQYFTQVYQRQTVKDFIALTVQFLTFLGEGFLSGALREAL